MKTCVVIENEFYYWTEINFTKEFTKKWYYKIVHFFSRMFMQGKGNENLFSIKMNLFFQNIITKDIYKKFLHTKTYGGFLENRAPVLGVLENESNYMIHLGIDINNIAPNTNILAAQKCKVVHVFNDKTPINGWGGRIIFELDTEYKGCKYLLYGHLDGNTLPKVGDTFTKGQVVAKLGNEKVNGGWYNHLHVQLITEYFYNLYEDKTVIDGYWFVNEDLSPYVSDPTNLVFNS